MLLVTQLMVPFRPPQGVCIVLFLCDVENVVRQSKRLVNGSDWETRKIQHVAMAAIALFRAHPALFSLSLFVKKHFGFSQASPFLTSHVVVVDVPLQLVPVDNWHSSCIQVDTVLASLR